MIGHFYVVGTPIGNLEDMTFRAIRILKEVDLVLCEDTRVTKKLLNHFEIENRCVSYHKFNEREKVDFILGEINKGTNIALTSDAGMPGISDPGEIIVKALRDAGIDPEVVPGPTALISALAISGLRCDKFYFLGFLDKGKTNKKIEFLKSLKTIDGTLIFYASPHRLKEELTCLHNVFGNIRCAVGRELTKKFETVKRFYLDEYFAGEINIMEKGELVILLENNYNKNDEKLELSLRQLYEEYNKDLSDLKVKDKIKNLEEKFKFNKKNLYNYIMEMKETNNGK